MYINKFNSLLIIFNLSMTIFLVFNCLSLTHLNNQISEQIKDTRQEFREISKFNYDLLLKIEKNQSDTIKIRKKELN